jgi:hypothetical protein
MRWGDTSSPFNCCGVVIGRGPRLQPTGFVPGGDILEVLANGGHSGIPYRCDTILGTTYTAVGAISRYPARIPHLHSS